MSGMLLALVRAGRKNKHMRTILVIVGAMAVLIAFNAKDIRRYVRMVRM